jgi:hypothetical protein
VISYPRRGTFATGVDLTDLADIRLQLEPLAARRAAENSGGPARIGLAELADTIEGNDIGAMARHEAMRWDLRAHRDLPRRGQPAPGRHAGALQQPGDPDLLPVPGPYDARPGTSPNT